MKGLRHAALSAQDLERARAFYEQHLGFKSYHCSDKDWLMLSRGATTISLVLNPNHKKPESFGSHPAHLGFCLENKNELKDWQGKLSKVDGIQVDKIHAHRDKSVGFYFSDTEGNQLEMIYIPVRPVFGPLDEAQDLLLVAHGSRDPEWKKPFVEIQQKLAAEDPRLKIQLAFLEFEGPGIEEIVDGLLEGRKEKLHLRVLPLFFSRGEHTKTDIPAILGGLEKMYSGRLKIDLLRPLMDQEHFAFGMVESLLLELDHKKSS